MISSASKRDWQELNLTRAAGLTHPQPRAVGVFSTATKGGWLDLTRNRGIWIETNSTKSIWLELRGTTKGRRLDSSATKKSGWLDSFATRDEESFH